MKKGAIGVCMLLSACASQFDFKAPTMAPDVRDEQELHGFEEQQKNEPKNLVLKAYVARQKELLLRRFLDSAATELQKGNFDAADQYIQRAFSVNPLSIGAKQGQEEIAAARRHQQWIAQAEEAIKADNKDVAIEKLRAVLIENSSQARAKTLLKQLTDTGGTSTIPAAFKASISKPITLEFRDAPIKTIFELISRNAGINFIFDKEVKGDSKTTIFVRNTKIEDAIRLILVTNQLDKKIIGDNTILIYPNTPTKQREYQELMVRSFYLANADVKQTVNVIKTMVKTNDLVYDEKLNMLIMRDTPDAIHLAEKLIAVQDMAEPEVMLELEVLEVSRNKLQALGIQYPEKLSFSAIGGASGTPGSLTLDEWKGLNSSTTRLTVTDPTLVINLRRLDTDTNLLANPRIRVKNRERAKVLIGERVPVITTTSTANVGISESVTYLDVGLKLDIEPNVYLEDEVAMKVGLEVSNILDTVTRSSGTQTYRLGTRNTSTTLRLKNGETQVLAGLIQDDERKSTNKVPGLGNIPLIGRFFSNDNTNRTKTEIVLLITPHVLRNLTKPELNVAEFPSGTAESIGSDPLQIRPVQMTVGAAPTLAPTVQVIVPPPALAAPTPPQTGSPPAPPAVQVPPLIPSSPIVPETPSPMPSQPSTLNDSDFAPRPYVDPSGI